MDWQRDIGFREVCSFGDVKHVHGGAAAAAIALRLGTPFACKITSTSAPALLAARLHIIFQSCFAPIMLMMALCVLSVAECAILQTNIAYLIKTPTHTHTHTHIDMHTHAP